MNARGLLFTCLALIIGSILLVPMSSPLGIPGSMASILSSLSLLGGIGAAFLTVNEEKDSENAHR
jgi:Na+/glutamate symporter